jgi:predicted HNH restriction endonuclease
MKDYRDIGLETYGNKCEICGHGLVEVHHIGYQEHQHYEDMLREAKGDVLTSLLADAKSKGFLKWDGHNLEKDNRSTNLSVLCSNCHTLVHTLDAGMNLLKAIPKRR